MEVRKLDRSEIERALELVWSTFLSYEAPDYTQEGIDTFGMWLKDPSFISRLVFYGAFETQELAGVLATRNNGSHVALFFVKGENHRRGIGRRLFEEVLKESPSDFMTVHSSPFALEVYHRLGFSDTDREQQKNGIRFTPMIYRKKES
jgi:GNAT superfamily N-acetyltransferase